MFTTGFKFWFTATLMGIAAAFVYAIGTNDGGILDTVLGPVTVGYKGGVGEHSGYSILIGFAGISLIVALLLSAWRDADPQSLAEVARTDEVPRPIPPATPSWWPVVGSFGLALGAVGAVTGLAFSVIGAALVLVAAVEWTISTWAERATSNPAENRALRARLLLPVEMPVIGAVFIAAFVVSGSRILLAASKTGSVIIAGVLASVILVLAVAFASRPKMARGVMNGVLVLGAVALLAGGVFRCGCWRTRFPRKGWRSAVQHRSQHAVGRITFSHSWRVTAWLCVYEWP